MNLKNKIRTVVVSVVFVAPFLVTMPFVNDKTNSVEIIKEKETIGEVELSSDLLLSNGEFASIIDNKYNIVMQALEKNEEYFEENEIETSNESIVDDKEEVEFSVQEEVTTNNNQSLIIEEESSIETTTYEPQTKENTTNSIQEYTSDEILLLRIASCEAGDQGVVGMAYVIKVVLNRVNSSEFPNNIRDVIYEKKQFSAIHTHWWYDEYIADGAEEALALVYNGWDETEGALYFCMPCSNGYHSSKLQYIKTYKGHEFYK